MLKARWLKELDRGFGGRSDQNRFNGGQCAGGSRRRTVVTALVAGTDVLSLSRSGKNELETMLSGQGLSLGGLIIYPVARDAGSVSYRQQRMGVSIDA